MKGDGAEMHANRVEMARDLIRNSRSGSISRLAKELEIQYAYARRIMDDLEASGLVSAPDKNGAPMVAPGDFVGNL
ncbi:DNA translocase FtsK [Sphingomonas sp. SKA58]|uniref:DNA translocase FtsK n=1 Tax=Sphingomonas sp. (strain SKA58) TaxID=314266 RepID=UPI0009FFA196|nr:DNA translocase FtsK [Sphingomonas sp. SKA58]